MREDEEQYQNFEMSKELVKEGRRQLCWKEVAR